MREFLRFVRHLFRLLHFTRGVLLILFAGLLVCALLIVACEGETFGRALYFVLITGLTIGYGDIVPTTALGRVVAIAAGVIGVIYVGIVVAIATRALTLAVQEHDGPAE